MRRVKFTCLAFLFCINVFAGKAPGLFIPGKISNPVTCDADASQSYAVYIPAQGNNNALPVIYFFDPHADGVLPLTKYKSLADEYGFILVGSNNSKNGNSWANAEQVWHALFTDSQKKLKINSNRIYACGFSGGAKVAGYVALKYPVIKGVIVNGAGLPDGVEAANFNFSFTGIAGEGDMNMVDVVSFSSSLDNTSTRHCMLLFDGKHEWAPSTTMALAFAGLQLDAMQHALTARNDTFINRYVEQSKQRFNAFYQSNHLLKAAEECDISINFLNGLSSEVTWFKKQLSALNGNSQFKQQQQAQQTLLAKEQDIKTGYMQQFETGDMVYWQKTVGNLQTLAAAKTAESSMYQRLLAWLSLAFYSVSNQLITAHKDADAGHFVSLYKLVDATNSEAWYFSAILNARQQHTQAAEGDLLKAVSNGFTDKKRLEQQPEFKQAAINLQGIESKMSGH